MSIQVKELAFIFHVVTDISARPPILRGPARPQDRHADSSSARPVVDRIHRHQPESYRGPVGLGHDQVFFGRVGVPVMVGYLDQRKGPMPEKKRDMLLFWFVQAGVWGRFSGSTESFIDPLTRIWRRWKAREESTDPEDFSNNYRERSSNFAILTCRFRWDSLKANGLRSLRSPGTESARFDFDLSGRSLDPNHQLQVFQRSHSPITKSREPRIVTTSLIMWPGRIFERILRLTKLGDRILRR
jgi:hypothetical protein